MKHTDLIYTKVCPPNPNVVHVVNAPQGNSKTSLAIPYAHHVRSDNIKISKVKHPVKPVKKVKPVSWVPPTASTAQMVKAPPTVYVIIVPPENTNKTKLVMIAPSEPTTTKPVKHHVPPVPMVNTKTKPVNPRVNPIKTVHRAPIHRLGTLKPVWYAKRVPKDAIPIKRMSSSVKHVALVNIKM